MVQRAANAAYMKKYLGYALECEKYVFLCNNILRITNDRMREINYRQDCAQNNIAFIQSRLISLKSTTQKNGNSGLFSFFASRSQSQISAESKQRQITILESEEQQALAELNMLNNAEHFISDQQDLIVNELRKVKHNLINLYAEDVLPSKYRNIESVATLYEYLAIPKYLSVYWSGGSIYSEYDKEALQIRQLCELIKIGERLRRIEDYQRHIYIELQNTNKILGNVQASLKEIQKTNEQIAANTAISAVANQQAAAEAQWLTFHAHLNGF